VTRVLEGSVTVVALFAMASRLAVALLSKRVKR